MTDIPSLKHLQPPAPKGRTTYTLKEQGFVEVSKHDYLHALELLATPESEVNMRYKHNLLGVSFAENALRQAKAALRLAKTDEEKERLETCVKLLEEAVQTWPLRRKP